MENGSCKSTTTTPYLSLGVRPKCLVLLSIVKMASHLTIPYFNIDIDMREDIMNKGYN